MKKMIITKDVQLVSEGSYKEHLYFEKLNSDTMVGYMLLDWLRCETLVSTGEYISEEMEETIQEHISNVLYGVNKMVIDRNKTWLNTLINTLDEKHSNYWGHGIYNVTVEHLHKLVSELQEKGYRNLTESEKVIQLTERNEEQIIENREKEEQKIIEDLAELLYISVENINKKLKVDKKEPHDERVEGYKDMFKSLIESVTEETKEERYTKGSQYHLLLNMLRGIQENTHNTHLVKINRIIKVITHTYGGVR